jgi:rsbT co-antagonist protein RsbR
LDGAECYHPQQWVDGSEKSKTNGDSYLMDSSLLTQFVEKNEGPLLTNWLQIQSESSRRSSGRITESELRTNSHDFVLGLRQGLTKGNAEDIDGAAWTQLKDMLTNLSRQRAIQGFSPAETAMVVFSFKEALFGLLRAQHATDSGTLTAITSTATTLLDRLGLFTFEVYQKSREEVIIRQQQEMLELSTPVVELWPGILALPLIGTLDSSRTQVVMQNLLEAIVAKEADLAIIDITGVPTVDTLVAQHLLKTVAAARLMGAECVISGIRPQIAQTIIHLGVDLGGVVTKASLADAFRIALRKKNLSVTKV